MSLAKTEQIGDGYDPLPVKRVSERVKLKCCLPLTGLMKSLFFFYDVFIFPFTAFMSYTATKYAVHYIE